MLIAIRTINNSKTAHCSNQKIDTNILVCSTYVCASVWVRMWIVCYAAHRLSRLICLRFGCMLIQQTQEHVREHSSLSFKHWPLYVCCVCICVCIKARSTAAKYETKSLAMRSGVLCLAFSHIHLKITFIHTQTHKQTRVCMGRIRRSKAATYIYTHRSLTHSYSRIHSPIRTNKPSKQVTYARTHTSTYTQG